MTEAVSDIVDIKVHYNYNGVPRCTLIDGTFSKLYEMDYTYFIAYLLEEIPQLTRLDPVKRLSFLDDEGTYIDLTSRNFHRFLRLSCEFKSDVPKINIKIYEGASPAPKLTRRNDDDNNNKSSKKSLVLDYEEFSKVPYKSPLELDMDLKRRELTVKETELQLVQSEYEQLWKKYNPVMYNDSSRSLCNRCHLRMGHNKNRSVVNC